MRLCWVLLSVFFICFIISGCRTEKASGSDQLDFTGEVDFGEEDYQQIVDSNNELGFQLLKKVPANDDGNTFISPFSSFVALSMVYNGAANGTKEEMAETLNLNDRKHEELNKANASLMTKLHYDSAEITLNVGNSLWLNDQFHLQDSFNQRTTDYFHAKTQPIDIMDSKSAKQINDWVKQATNNKIEEIADQPLDKNLVAMLINAIYFKGTWTHEFDKEKTEDRTFHVTDNTSKEVPMMHVSEELPYMENQDFQAVQLPYGEDENINMTLFLPKDASNLDHVEELIGGDWKKRQSEFQTQKGTVLLPKFKLEYEALLNDALEELGMSAAFDKETADFSNMIEGNAPLWLSNVKQKTFIKVNEEGTEAAGATSIEVQTESARIDQPSPFQMEVDHPFLFTITDRETGTILFIGRVLDPS